MRTAILGLGVTGTSCVRHLAGVDDVVVIDTRAEPPGADQLRQFTDVSFHFGVETFDFSGFDRVVVSPGIPLDHCLVRSAASAGAALVSDIDLFFAAAQAPVLTVTGTNGKSTVVSMAAQILSAGGFNAVAGGNLGLAALDALNAQTQVYVLELSSFQLERMQDHPVRASMILNVSEDHIDRHGNMLNYAKAKQRIHRRSERRVFNRADARTQPEGTGGQLVSFGLDSPTGRNWGIRTVDGEPHFACGDKGVAPVASLRVPGAHNQQNFLAACALTGGFMPPTDAFAEVAETYSGLPHRCRVVAEINGVVFVNDSKATNVGATVAAVDGLIGAEERQRKVVLLAGGEGKGADFRPLAELLPKLRGAVLYGRDADLIGAVLEPLRPARAQDLGQALRKAVELAETGDYVLLAPACASFDMFANYAQRGEVFERLVQEMAA